MDSCDPADDTEYNTLSIGRQGRENRLKIPGPTLDPIGVFAEPKAAIAAPVSPIFPTIPGPRMYLTNHLLDALLHWLDAAVSETGGRRGRTRMSRGLVSARQKNPSEV